MHARLIISLIVNVSPAMQITITISPWLAVYKPFQIVKIKPAYALANVQAAPRDTFSFKVDCNVAQV